MADELDDRNLEAALVLRQVYRAGEKPFVDYAGSTVEVTDRRTREVHEAKVFVGVLAASNHTFVDVTLTRSLPDWTALHMRMFEFWGGVPELVIPDNEKATVRRASRYEPDVNRTYHDLAVHYGTAVLPARPRSLQDKAKVEEACTRPRSGPRHRRSASGYDRSRSPGGHRERRVLRCRGETCTVSSLRWWAEARRYCRLPSGWKAPCSARPFFFPSVWGDRIR